MTRHARNCTAGSVYTYHERKKDTGQSGYGSQKMRVGKDSVKDFDCCCLTLQPCRDPVITAEGYLYNKEAILENILHQKKDIGRKLKEYEKQKTKLQAEKAAEGDSERATMVKKFIEKESSITGKQVAAFMTKPSTSAASAAAGGAAAVAGSSKDSQSVSNMVAGKNKELPSFWVPALTPMAKATQLQKPDEKVRCPMSGKTLKLKDLIPVKFTPIKDRDDKTAVISKQARYVCAVTNDVLGNSVPCVLLRTSGNVVTADCLEKIIKKDMIDPTNGQKLREKDIIYLQRGSTGFSGGGVNLHSQKHGAALMA